MKNNGSRLQRYFWKAMVDIWAIIAMTMFTMEFLYPDTYNASVSFISVIYPSILTVYTGTKEFSRWNSKNFKSLFSGEAFVILWTGLFLTFVIFSFIGNGRFHVTLEMSTTYVAVLGVFAIAWQSKNLRAKK